MATPPYTREAILRSVGNTELSAIQIKQLAEAAIRRQDDQPTEIMIYRTAEAHRGGYPEAVQIVFDRFDDEVPNIILGYTPPGGPAWIFMMNDDSNTVTVLMYEPAPQNPGT